MFCNQCGEDNRDDRDYCISCGNPLKEGLEKTPKQIKKEEKERYEYIQCNTRTYQVINIVLWSLVLVSAILTFTSYGLKDTAKFVVIVIALILLLGCLGLALSKRIMRKLTKEKVRKADKESSQSATTNTQEYEQITIESIPENVENANDQQNESPIQDSETEN